MTRWMVARIEETRGTFLVAQGANTRQRLFERAMTS
jgi:hypothetical protein